MFFYPEENKNGKEKEAFSNQLREAEVVYWGRCPECLAETPVTAGG
jgi:hypothetical protein